MPACRRAHFCLLVGILFLLPSVVLAKVPRRPKGVTPTAAVAQAVELLLLADQYGWSTPGAVDSGRALVRNSEADSATLSLSLWQAADRWSKRGTADAHRLIGFLQAPLQPQEARALIENGDDLPAKVAAMVLVDGCMHTIKIANALSLSDAHRALAQCSASTTAAESLSFVGEQLEQLQPQTQVGRDLVPQWRDTLATARLPDLLPYQDLLQFSDGVRVGAAPAILRMHDDTTTLVYRPVISVVQGRVVTDAGPPAETLTNENPDVVLRWQTIASRRAVSSQQAGMTTTRSQASNPEPDWLAAVAQDVHYRRLDDAIRIIHPNAEEQTTTTCWVGNYGAQESMQCFDRTIQSPEGAFIVRIPDPDPARTRVDLLALQGSGTRAWIVPSDETTVAEVSDAISDLRALGLPVSVARAEGLPQLADAE